MVTLLIFLLFLTGLILAFLGRKRLSLALLSACFVCFCLVGSGPIPYLLHWSLESKPHLIEPKWEQKNLIAILGGGIYHRRETNTYVSHPLALARALEGARLYRQCRSQGKECKLLTTGGDVHKFGISEAQVMKNELVQMGISGEDILLEETSRNTYENAKFSGPIIGAHDFKKIVVVSSGFHVKRAAILFEHFKLAVDVAPSESVFIHFGLPTGVNFYLSDAGAHEYGGLVKFYLWNALGWDY